MTLDRVFRYIKQNRSKSLIYIKNGKVGCTFTSSKLTPTILRNKKNQYQIVGIYTQKISIKELEDDLLAMGIWE